MGKDQHSHWWNLDHTPKSARRSLALKASLKTLVKGGSTNHSIHAATLPLMIAGLEEQGIPYVIEAFPGKGYVITGKPN